MVTVRRSTLARQLLTENLYLNLERSGATAATAAAGDTAPFMESARWWARIRRPARARVRWMAVPKHDPVGGRTG